MSRGWMKAGSDWCLFLPSGEESSELGSTDDSLDGNDAGGEYDGDLGEWCLGGDDAGGEHDGGIGGCLTCLVCQTSWTGCPCSSLHCQYSSLHCQRTRLWPGWSDGLERNCLWAVSSLFSLDGLERRSCHDIWASSELCSFCRLCRWGPGSCRSIHI